MDLFSRFDLETRNTRDDKHKKTLEEKDVGNKSPRQSQQERVQLLEFFEEIFDEIFNSCEWGKDLQVFPFLILVNLLGRSCLFKDKF